MTIKETPEFSKDIKKLKKKFISLPSSVNECVKVMENYHSENRSDGNFVFLTRKEIIPNLFVEIYKIRGKWGNDLKKDKNKFRLVYAYVPSKSEIFLIELYYKGEKENEDQEKIKEFLKDLERQESLSIRGQ